MRESFSGVEAQMDNPDFRHAYAASFMNACVAAQIKIIREQRGWTQAELAERIGTKQAGISRLENVNYDAWKVETLTRVAKAFDVRLRISFEEFNSLIDEIDKFGQASLQRDGYESVKEREVQARLDVQPSENLLRALDPTRPIPPQRETVPLEKAEQVGERHAIDIGAAGKSLRLLGARGIDARDRHLSSEPSGLSGGKMPVPKEPEHTPGIQFG